MRKQSHLQYFQSSFLRPPKSLRSVIGVSTIPGNMLVVLILVLLIFSKPLKSSVQQIL